MTCGVDQHQRILQHAHHAQAEQVDLDEPHVGAVFLVPLHDHAAGHAGVLERHHLIEPVLADDHAAAVLAQMPRQVLHAVPEIGELAHPRIDAVHADLAQVPGQRLAAVHELEAVHQLGQPIDQIGVKAQRLAHFPRGAAVAVGDDVGRHRRAQLAVALVDVLDHALAPIAAGQVEIDVGPLAALFREEPLEEQLHPDRVDGGDAEAVADGAVGRRPAALHEDAALAAEVDQVPDDEEVAGQIELLDQIQLAADLRPRAVVIRPIPLARADLRDLAQKRRHRLARRHRVLRKAIAQVGHRVLEPIGQLARGGDGLRQIGKARRHGLGRSQVALGIGRPAGGPPAPASSCDGGR